jgi:VWFA-related protein
MRKLICLFLVCGLLTAQQSKSKRPEPKPRDSQDQTIPTFRAPVTNIRVPTKVYGPNRNFLTGIASDRFHLFDNGKEQNVFVDESLIPISMVIAIQCNAEVDRILPKVNRIGGMIAPLLVGGEGEAAVIAFDSRVRTLQEFTSDPDKITEAVSKLRSGSTPSRLVDAVDAAEHMLRERPTDRQKIVLLISETRDEGSTNGRLDTLDYLQVDNIIVYTVTMSRVLGKLTAPAADPRLDNRPPAMNPMPSGVPATPTSVMQTYGTEGGSAQFIPVFAEVLKNIKYAFRMPAADLFTQGTGGSKFDFYGGKGLEDAIEQMAVELHLQYMLTYSPNNKADGGWHDIKVVVDGVSKVRVRTRPGYWMAADIR